MPIALLLIAATHPLAQASGLDLAYVTSFGDGTWARPTHAVLVVEEGLEVLLVVDNANGVYRVTFTPAAPGQHVVHERSPSGCRGECPNAAHSCFGRSAVVLEVCKRPQSRLAYAVVLPWRVLAVRCASSKDCS